jgi:hypothetical protein
MQIEAVQEPDGKWNLTRLFPPTPPEQEQTEPTDLPTLTVRRFQIVDSAMTYRDRTRQAESHFTLHVRDLTTDPIDLRPHGLATPVVTRIDGKLDQSPLHGDAQVFWQREQTEVEASIEAQSLPFTTIEPYLQESLAFQKLAGQLEVALHYRYRDGGEEPPVHALNGTVTAADLHVADPLSQQTILDVPSVHAEIETIDFLHHNIRVTTVELRDPKVTLLQTPTGMNLASLIRSAESPTVSHDQTTSTSPWRFTLQTVKSTGGEITYRDSRWPEAETVVLSPQTIEITQIGSAAGESPFHFRTRLGEGIVTGEGTLRFTPFTLQGQFQPTGVDVTTLRPFLATALPGKTLQGMVTGTVQSELIQQEGDPVLRLNGNLETAKFQIEGLPETGSSIGWESGQVEIAAGSTVMPLALQFKPQLSRLLFHRPTPGDLTVENLQGSLMLAQTTTADDSQPLTLSGTVETTQLTLNGAPEPASVLAWENGQIEIRDGSTLVPLVLEVNTQVSKVSLQGFSQGDVAIEKANSTLRLAQEESPQQEQILQAQGPVELTGFVLTQGPEKQILLGCYHATATIAEGSHLLPFAVRLRDVALEYTYAQGFRTASGQFQLFIPPAQGSEVTTLPMAEAPPPLVAPTTTPEAEAPLATQAGETATGPTLYIDQVSMIGGELYFEDRAVTPTQTIYWQDVRMDLHPASYPLVFPAVFSAHAYNEEGAPVEFKGTTEKQGEQTIIRVQGRVQKMSLSRFNAYLIPSLGYRVNKGTVTATWDLVLPSERFQADMQVTLHNLTLGGKDKTSELEQQVGLPLALVIALLKDLNGNINLRLPVAGRLNEPGFQLEGTILRAIRDVLIGAVVSPLKLLGAIFTGKEELEDFTFQPLQFLPGTSQMTESAKEQLRRVSQFLAQRPGLDLRLSGVVGSEDVQLLKDQAILAQLAAERPSAPEPTENATETPGEPGQLTPQEEVRRFLTQQLHPTNGISLPPLSESATTLLVQLRQTTRVAPEVTERLTAERVQTVTTELTARYAIAATRLHVRQEKPRGAGAAEVRYVIQTREGVTAAIANTSAAETPEKRKREGR